MPKTKYTRPIKPIIFPVGPSIAYVTLTKGLYALIDAADIPLVSPYNWCAHEKPGGHYAVRNILSLSQKSHIKMHRFLMGTVTPAIDHVNGNRLDNRRANLRVATTAENLRNQKRHSNNTSGFKGVSKKQGRWRVSIMADGKRHYFGTFDTPEEAHDVYIVASKKYHGEFARSA
jgi:hypothetical protein